MRPARFTVTLVRRVGPTPIWFLLLLCACAAQGQTIGEPLSGAVGDPLYSESTQVGPSSSLLPQGTSVTSPNYRTGTSDPLGTLIETGSMSPYLSNVYLTESYANANVIAQTVNDSTLARNFDEYRNNHGLMAGTLPTGSLLGRATLTGAGVSGGFGSRGAGESAGFGRATMLVPFAAGSSALAHQPTTMLGFVDPNMLVAASTLGASMPNTGSGTMASGSPGGSPAQASSGSGFASSTVPGGSLAASGSVSSMADPFAAGIAPLQAAMAGGAGGTSPAPMFPSVSLSGPSTTGFPDSTMGTAGQAAFSETSSPFRSPSFGMDADRASPFQDVSGQMSTFLRPSLIASASSAGATPNLRAYARKAHLQATMSNPGGEMLSPFQQRATLRAYQAQHRRGDRPSKVTMAPSVVATP